MLFKKQFSYYFFFVFFCLGLLGASSISAQDYLPDYVPLQATMTDLGVHFYLYNAGTKKASEFFYIRYEWVDANKTVIAGKGGKTFIEAHIGDIGKWKIRESREMNHNNAMDSKVQNFLWNPPRGATQLKMTIDSHNEFLEVDETNNIAFMNVVLPDLVIESASLKDAGISFVVKNQGTASARPDYYLRFRWITENGEVVRTQNGLEEYSREIFDNAIAINESRVFAPSYSLDSPTKFIQNPPKGAQYLEMAVDVNDAIVESNDKNNSRRVEIPRPDMKVEQFLFTDGNVKIEVLNSGEASTRKNFSMRMMWQGDNGQEKTQENSFVDITIYDNFRPNSREMYTSDSTFLQNQRDFILFPPAYATHLLVILDPENVLEESHEENNTASTTFPRPDLHVGEFSFDENGMRVEILNEGDGSVRENFPLRFIWKGVDESSLDFTVYAPMETQGKRVIISKEFFSKEEKEFFLNPPKGATYLTITLDPENTISENDETNNYAEVNIPLPDIQFGSLTFSSDGIQFTIFNNGKILNKEPIKVRFYWTDKDEKSILGFNQSKSADLQMATFLRPNGRLIIGAGDILDQTQKEFINNPPENAERLYILLDPDDAIFESNEANNNGFAIMVPKNATGEDLAQKDEAILLSKIAKELITDGTAEDVKKQLNPTAPGDATYFFKAALRETKNFFTFDPEKKAELRADIATERILEINKLLENGDIERAQKHLEKYINDLSKIDGVMKKLLKEDPARAAELKKERVTMEIETQLVLGKIERKAKGENEKLVKKIEDTLEKTREHLSQKLAEIPEEHVKEILEKILDSSGTPFRELQNLEILSHLTAVPDVVNELKKKKIETFSSHIENIPPEEQKLLSEYVKESGGNQENYIAVVQNALLLTTSPSLGQELIEVQKAEEEKSVSKEAENKVTENQVVEAEKEKEPEKPVEIVPQELSDLLFQKVWFWQQYLRTNIQNNGTASSGDFSLALQWVKDGKYVGESFLVSLGTLEPGKEIEWKDFFNNRYEKTAGYFLLLNQPDDYTHLRLILDPENKILEKNEENNTYEIARFFPDIQITKFQVNPGAYGDRLDLYVENRDFGVIRDGFDLWLQWVDKDRKAIGNPVTLRATYSPMGIYNANGWNIDLRKDYYTESSDYAYYVSYPPKGAYELSVITDPKNVITESNEENNRAFLQMPNIEKIEEPKCTEDQWECSAWGECSLDGKQTRKCELKDDCSLIENIKPSEAQTCTPTKEQIEPEKFPDLSIESVEIIIATEDEGFSGAFTTDIINAGKKDASSSQARLRIDLGNDGSWDQTAPLIDMDGLPASNSSSKSWILLFSEGASQALAEFCIDSENAVEEEDENDNCVTQEFAID